MPCRKNPDRMTTEDEIRSAGYRGKVWRCDSAKTQAAAAEVAAVIGWFEQRGWSESADLIRQAAMRHGVREAKAELQRVFRTSFNALRQST